MFEQLQEHASPQSLQNYGSRNNHVFACTQFGFYFDRYIVSRKEYEEFLRLPPGDLSYFVYKQKELCDSFVGKAFSAWPPRTTAGINYRRGSNVSHLFSSVNNSYGKLKFSESAKVFGIRDYDLILNSRLEIEYTGSMGEYQAVCAQADMHTMLQEHFKRLLPSDPPGPANSENFSSEIDFTPIPKRGVIGKIGYYKKITASAGKGQKIGINFFAYILERQQDGTLHIFYPNGAYLFSMKPGERRVIRKEPGYKEAEKIKRTKQEIANMISARREAFYNNLDNNRIHRTLMEAFRDGIFNIHSLYLADDARVEIIEESKVWGILNYKYRAYYAIDEEDALILFDDSKFELKTYRGVGVLQAKSTWREVLIEKFNACHYPLSPDFPAPEPDKRGWLIYRPDKLNNAPEFHKIPRAVGEDIYVTRYLKVSLSDPDDVILKIERNLMLALENNVSVLCLPELAFFLPRGKLEAMLKAVVRQCQQKKITCSGMLIISTTYLKYKQNTSRLVNLGAGVYIQLDETGINQIKVTPFPKQIYASDEYAMNNIEPGEFMKSRRGNAANKNYLHWLDVYAPHINRESLLTTNTCRIRVLYLPGKIRLFFLICCDVIGDKVYDYSLLMKSYQDKALAAPRDSYFNVLVISANSAETTRFYNKIEDLKDCTDMIIFSNNGGDWVNTHHAGLGTKFGRSYIYCKDMKQDRGGTTALYHFDPITLGHHPRKHVALQCNNLGQAEAEMIIVEGDFTGKNLICRTVLKQEIPGDLHSVLPSV